MGCEINMERVTEGWTWEMLANGVSIMPNQRFTFPSYSQALEAAREIAKQFGLVVNRTMTMHNGE